MRSDESAWTSCCRGLTRSGTKAVSVAQRPAALLKTWRIFQTTSCSLNASWPALRRQCSFFPCLSMHSNCRPCHDAKTVDTIMAPQLVIVNPKTLENVLLPRLQVPKSSARSTHNIPCSENHEQQLPLWQRDLSSQRQICLTLHLFWPESQHPSRKAHAFDCGYAGLLIVKSGILPILLCTPIS